MGHCLCSPVSLRDSQSGLVVALVGGSHFVNHAYMMLLPPIFGPLQSQLGLTNPQLGVALGVFGFVVTALQIPFGYLSDSRSRTLVLTISLSVGAVGAVLTAMAQSYAWLLVSQVILGIGVAGHHPSHYPLISAATDEPTRGRAYSVHGFTGALGFAAPPAVVALTATAGFDWRLAVGIIALVGALYGVLTVLTFQKRVDRDITHPDPKARREAVAGRSLRARFWTGARDIVNSPAIVALTVLWFATSVAGWGIKQYTATLLADGYAVGPNTANVTVSAMLTIGAVLIFAGGWLTDRYDASSVLVAGYAALVFVAGVLAWQGLPVIAALGFTLLLSATIDGTRPARAALADRFSSSGDVGKNFGLLTIGISGGAAVAPPVFGVVVEQSGVATVFSAIAAVGVVALALTALVVSLSDGRYAGVAQPGD